MSTSMNDIIQSQIDAYRPNFLQYGDTPQGTFQNNISTIEERHKQLMTLLLPLLPLNFSLCDFGSGTCDLHGYLLKCGIKHRYTGIEIVPEMREISLKKYPDIEILGSNILDDQFTTTYDVVVASGTFNLRGNVEIDLWESYVLSIIAKMYKISRIGIAYNAITAYSDFRADSLYYMNPDLAITHTQREMSRFFTLSSAYPLFEFTMTVFHPEIVSNAYPEQEFSKYFTTRVQSR